MGLAPQEGVRDWILLKDFENLTHCFAETCDFGVVPLLGQTKQICSPTIHGALPGYAGGSAIGLSATDAYGQKPQPVMGINNRRRFRFPADFFHLGRRPARTSPAAAILSRLLGSCAFGVIANPARGFLVFGLAAVFARHFLQDSPGPIVGRE